MARWSPALGLHIQVDERLLHGADKCRFLSQVCLSSLTLLLHCLVFLFILLILAEMFAYDSGRDVLHKTRFEFVNVRPSYFESVNYLLQYTPESLVD